MAPPSPKSIARVDVTRDIVAKRFGWFISPFVKINSPGCVTDADVNHKTRHLPLSDSPRAASTWCVTAASSTAQGLPALLDFFHHFNHLYLAPGA
jgi:hypothetical protein